MSFRTRRPGAIQIHTVHQECRLLAHLHLSNKLVLQVYITLVYFDVILSKCAKCLNVQASLQACCTPGECLVSGVSRLVCLVCLCRLGRTVSAFFGIQRNNVKTNKDTVLLYVIHMLFLNVHATSACTVSCM